MAKLSECSVGAVFGRLTVKEVKVVPAKGRLRKYVVSTCSCGKIVESRADGLGVDIFSCGCLNAENTAAKGRANKTHGLRQTRAYSSWAEMWQRTTNPQHEKYMQYKSRTPPEIWKDFAVFYAELGERPKGYTLERVRNELPYGPGNCKWATVEEQNRNTGRVRRFQFRGQEVLLADLERKFNMSHGALSYRHYTKGETLHSIFQLQPEELLELDQP